MTWMIIRLILSPRVHRRRAVLRRRVAKKRGLGQGNGLIEVVARQRMGRASTVNVVRVADGVLVVGATEEQVTLLAEVDSETIETALAERGPPPAGGRRRPTARRRPAARRPRRPHLDRAAGRLGASTAPAGAPSCTQLRERTVRRP